MFTFNIRKYKIYTKKEIITRIISYEKEKSIKILLKLTIANLATNKL